MLSFFSISDRLSRIYILTGICLHYELFIAPSPYGSVRMRSKWLTDNTDATDFIFFTDFLNLRYTWSWFFSDFFLRPYGAGYTPARDNPQIVHRVMEIRKNQSAVKAHINSHKNKISEEQIRRIGVIRD